MLKISIAVCSQWRTTKSCSTATHFVFALLFLVEMSVLDSNALWWTTLKAPTRRIGNTFVSISYPSKNFENVERAALSSCKPLNSSFSFDDSFVYREKTPSIKILQHDIIRKRHGSLVSTTRTQWSNSWMLGSISEPVVYGLYQGYCGRVDFAFWQRLPKSRIIFSLRQNL